MALAIIEVLRELVTSFHIPCEAEVLSIPMDQAGTHV